MISILKHHYYNKNVMSASYQFIKIFLGLLTFFIVLLCSCCSHDWIRKLLCVVLSYVDFIEKSFEQNLYFNHL